MATPYVRDDIVHSCRRAMMRQGWLFGERLNRMGNPFTWVDGSQISAIEETAGMPAVAQYLAMSGEFYDTPAAIRVADHDAVLADLEARLGRIVDHLMPFRAAAGLDFQRYVRSTALVKVQDYSAIRTLCPTLPRTPVQVDLGPGLGANALYSIHHLGARYVAVDAHAASYEVQRQFYRAAVAPEPGYLDLVDCETFEMDEAALAAELARADRYAIRHVPSWHFGLLAAASADLVSATWVLNEVTPAGITWLLHHAARVLKPGGFFYIRDSGLRKPLRHDLDYDDTLVRLLGFTACPHVAVRNRIDMHGLPRAYRRGDKAAPGFDDLFEQLFGRNSVAAHGGAYMQASTAT
jgi:SAM-dependent methyltransferase